MWRYLADSVGGTSHEKAGSPCQDCHRVTSYTVDGKSYLVIVCADGAGSASHAETGSEIACDTTTAQVVAHLEGTRSLAGVDRSIATGWLGAVRTALTAAAEKNGVELRQLSCTLLIAVVGETESVFTQIGDGAIVALLNTDVARLVAEPIFWPQNGEYANTTYFVTDERAADIALFTLQAGPTMAVAVFTDGLQALALDVQNRSAYEPFFSPLFRLLADAPEPSDLDIPFRQFLRSQAVNDRTDDDKTLVIAVRDAERDR